MIDQYFLELRINLRWDKASIDELPEHVKWTYKAILEAFDDVEQELAKEARSIYINFVIEQVCEPTLSSWARN